MSALQGSVAVVTGAGRGLGAALAICLADAGCTLVLCGRDQQALAGVAGTIEQRTGMQADCVVLNLADTASVSQAVESITSRHPALDILVNNGAMWLEADEQGYSADAVSGVINAAVTGTYLFTQGLLPTLRRSARPDILTIGSISALPNAALQGVSVPFYAAKQAQRALAEGLSQQLAGTPVRSLCVHPPYLDDVSPTEPAWEAAAQRQKGERGTNRDVVEAVLFALTRPRHVSLSSIVIDSDEGGLFG
ncbi:SDR family oxidoreductase [Pseudomonas fontis]|uniref:SDR family NAD(P)-dependent oxidoreductase n=1 Tax=Pseudomonas fontis TaxID=2942633 RepID=A0ABT5NZ32_9PSED|nr:SDR family NAD(P)-dependent oxidoreductase [Pseudomonas fontis]MDD0977563.1 SDR family NAD(P)-dependent oxidoreductase [Pseudomonas fontis]MDD0993459.1 SDR family NAD(P)-dependent oxidoreductase [Pseudomonas fontis]